MIRPLPALPSIRVLAFSATLVASAFLLPVDAVAQGFSVGPVRIAMSAEQPSASIEVRSGDFTSEVLVQATAFAWTEVDGNRELSPTTELVITPAVFKLDPGGVRTLVLSAPQDGPVPRYYRIRVEEVADEAQAEVATVQLRMLRAFDLPVFVEASGAAADVRAEAVVDHATGEARLRLHNHGDGYAVGTAARLRIGETTLTEETGLYYLLPGQGRDIVLALPVEASSAPRGDDSPLLTWEVDDDRGTPLATGTLEARARDTQLEYPRKR